MRLAPTATAFTRHADFVFDDPARTFNGAPITVFDGKLDAEARPRFEKDLDLPRDVPGMLNATFITRVFERGGAFSINRETRTVAAFDRYVGLKLPKGDAARDMLLTDTRHTVELASVDLDGAAGVHPAPAGLALQGANGAGGGTRTAIRWRSTRRAKAPASSGSR